MAPVQRLFFALWPSADERAAVAPWLSEAGAIDPRARATRIENLHLTLAFLGDVDGDRRQCCERAASALRAKAFTLDFERIGVWRRNGICWLEASMPPEALAALVSGLRSTLRACNFEPEQRPYKAHLTLARRVYRPYRAREIEPVRWRIDRFCLVESELGAQRTRYRVLRTWELS